MQITVLNNQTLLDIGVMYCGTVESAADIAVLNNISITDDLIAGQLILIPSKDYGNQEVINYFISNKIESATGITITNIEDLLPELGIGTMAIGSTFIVR